MRYDGYYILADLTEIPNLRQKATTILSRKMGEWFLGLEQPEDPFLPERNQIFFALYSVASAIYRWVVVFSILLFLYKVFKPYGLEVIGQMIALASLWGLVVMPLYQVGKFFYVPGRLDKVKKPRMYASLARGGGRRGGRALRAAAAQRDVHAGSPGPRRRAGLRRRGRRRPTGQGLRQAGRARDQGAAARPSCKTSTWNWKSPNSKASRRRYAGPIARTCNGEGFHDRQAASQIPEVQKALEAVEKQLKEKRARPAAAAPAGPVRRHRPAAAGHHRPRGPGRPVALLVRHAAGPGKPRRLSPRRPANESVHVLPDRRSQKLEAILVIDQGDIEYVREGQDGRHQAGRAAARHAAQPDRRDCPAPS